MSGRRFRWVAAFLLASVALFGQFLLASELIDPARFVQPDDSVLVFDRHGQPLRHVRVDGIDRHWVRLAEVSPHLIDAFLATEDARFYEHGAIDARATLRALASVFVPGRRISGASTITQQAVKLAYGRSPGILAKALEILRATALEKEFSKAEILEQYLNRVPFGDRIEGVARASEEYFGHSVAQLSFGEAALLAGIPQAPSVTEPRRHLERALARRHLVLDRLLALGKIGRDDYEAALAEPVQIQAHAPRPWQAPQFTSAALRAARHGARALPSGRLVTSLDLTLQSDAERILEAALRDHGGRGATNAAALIVATGSGEILAYVGTARAGSDAAGGFLDLVQRRRQPGSTLKPLVYGLFFERAGTPASLLDDVAFPMTGAGGRLHEAHDYDGRERGPVRARVALASSLNLAALDAVRRLGPDRVLTEFRRFGLVPRGDSERYGAGAVLGGIDVSPLELTGAYLTLARGGLRIEPRFEPSSGTSPEVRVISAESAADIAEVLGDAALREDAFGGALESESGGHHFALKTGTSSGWRDAWAAAYDELHTVVVWVGDPSGQPMRGLSGFEAAAPTAARLLGAARVRSAENGSAAFRFPADQRVTVSVCAATGLRPGPRCRRTIDEHFAPDRVPSALCTQHGPHGELLLGERYREWIERTQPAGVAIDEREARSDTAPRIRSPADGARFLIRATGAEAALPLVATVDSEPAPRAEFIVDGRPLGAKRWTLAPGAHEIVAVLDGRRSEPARIQVEAR